MLLGASAHCHHIALLTLRQFASQDGGAGEAARIWNSLTAPLDFMQVFQEKKQRSSQQTVIFIVFTAELLQYSTESHEIKLLLKTRPKKIKHRKQTKKTCCMAATANLFP